MDNEPEFYKRLAKLETVFQSVDEGEEANLAKLFSALWKSKLQIAAIVCAFAVASIIYVLQLPDQYKASAVLTPASSSNVSNLSQLASQFGGLASLVGVNLGSGGGDDKTVVAMELVKSWGFLESFIRDNGIELEVFAANGWDRATNKLRLNPKIYDVKQKKWVRRFNPGKGQALEPSGWELYKELSERIDIAQDKKTGFITLSVEFYSPEISKQWVDKLVVAVNRYLQKSDQQEASKSIEYLQMQISRTGLAEMQTVFYKLIGEQTKSLMLAEISDEYALRTLSPAKAPEEKSRPKRVIIVVLATMFGMFFGVLWVIARNAYAKSGSQCENE